MTTSMAFAIRSLMARAGIETKQDLIRRSRISHGALLSLEQGRANQATLAKVAGALGVTEAQLYLVSDDVTLGRASDD